MAERFSAISSPSAALDLSDSSDEVAHDSFFNDRRERARPVSDGLQCDFYGAWVAFEIFNAKASSVCSCLKGFKPKQEEEWNGGNWSDGCVRNTPLKCEKLNDTNAEEDGFLQMEMVKVQFATRHRWTKLLSFQFSYLIFLFAFSFLFTTAVVFIVASLYTSKPVSYSSTISAIPKVFKRLFVTFLWVSLLMIIYNFIFFAFLVLLILAINTQNYVLFFLCVVIIFILFLVVHVYITALWHLASIVSVLEPIYGLAAMKKIYELLKGKTRFAAVLVFAYLAICATIAVIFEAVVVHGGTGYGVFVRIVAGGFLVGVLVIVNLVGLLVQSVFYYVCKSFHRQGIDKLALHYHLGGYLV